MEYFWHLHPYAYIMFNFVAENDLHYLLKYISILNPFWDYLLNHLVTVILSSDTYDKNLSMNPVNSVSITRFFKDTMDCSYPYLGKFNR